MMQELVNSSGRDSTEAQSNRLRFGLRGLFAATLAICILPAFGRLFVLRAEETQATSRPNKGHAMLDTSRPRLLARTPSIALHTGLSSVPCAAGETSSEGRRTATGATGSVLHRAAGQGETESIRQLLTQGADVNAQDARGRTPLIVAIERRQLDAAKLLLEHGADVEKQTPDGISPLYAAAFQGRQACIEMLIDHGAKVDARCALGRTALFPAAAEGHAGCAQALLKHGADVTARANSAEVAATPLHGAAVEGQVETARVLLDHGADPNVRDDKWNITPLYLATVLKHKDLSALLLSRGAQPDIADAYGMTPSIAASLMAQRSSRQLTTIAHGFDQLNPRAIVYLIYLGRTQRGYRVKAARLAFAIGDGRHLVTAAHCLEDFRGDSGEAIARPFLISPHYGDLFQAAVVATDEASDVALLRASWPTHPALKLATSEDITRAKQMAVAGFPPHEEKGRLSEEVFLEQLSAAKIDFASEKRAICLAAASFVGPGWSGAPIVLPNSGEVAGVFSSHDLVHLDDRVLLHNLYGCDVQAVFRLLSTSGIELSESVETDEAEDSSKPDESFLQLLRYFECFMQGDVEDKLKLAHQLKARRPSSPQIRMLLALAAHEKYIVSQKNDGKAQQLASDSFQETIDLLADSDSSFARTAFGCFLLYDGRSEDAVRQLREARRMAPRDTFIAISLLRALTGRKSKEALVLGDSLCREHPQHHQCWFAYAGALREFGKFNEAVAAAEDSIRTGGPNFYRGRLASVLSKAGRLDEAKSVYEEMLEIQPQEGIFWLWYARFLIEEHSQQQDDARHALDQAEQFSTPRTVPRAELERLRQLLETE